MLESSQFGGGPPTHDPPEHVSFVVQALPSSQELLLLVYTHTPLGQVSVVHGLLSSHWLAVVHSMQPGIGVPLQTPPEQVSLFVQAWPSSQELVLLLYWQPLAGLQESSVQGLLSSQFTVVPAQLPPEHVSFVVQKLPSSQGFELLA